MKWKDQIGSIWKQLISIGILPEDKPFFKLRISLLNQSSWFAICLIPIAYIPQWYHPVKFSAVFILPFPILILLLNRFRLSKLSFILSTTVWPTFMFAYHLLYGESLGLGYIFLVFITATTLFYSDIKWILINVAWIIGYLLIGKVYSKYYLLHAYHYPVHLLSAVTANIAAIFIIAVAISKVFNLIKLHYKTIANTNYKLTQQQLALTTSLAQNQHQDEILSILARELLAPVNAFNRLSDRINDLIKNNELDQLQSLASHFEKQGKILFNDVENLLSWVEQQKEHLTVHKTMFSIRPLTDHIFERMNTAYDHSLIFSNSIPGTELVYADQNIFMLVMTTLLEYYYQIRDAVSRIEAGLSYDSSQPEIILKAEFLSCPESISENLKYLHMSQSRAISLWHKTGNIILIEKAPNAHIVRIQLDSVPKK